MKTKFITISLLLSSFMISCGGSEKADKVESSKTKEHKVESHEVQEKETASESSSEGVNKGIGPVKSVTLTDIDEALAEQGKELYKANCTACHKIGKRLIGPALKGVTERRSPEWIMNMILNPEEMVQKDPIAKELLAKYVAPMANQSLNEEEARAILEFFRTKN